MKRIKGEAFCLDCHHVGKAKIKIPGSPAIELLLWLFFLLPGVIYSAWRGSARHSVCRCCGSPGVIPANSSRARDMLGNSGEDVL